jgi:hypothetical protein
MKEGQVLGEDQVPVLMFARVSPFTPECCPEHRRMPSQWHCQLAVKLKKRSFGNSMLTISWKLMELLKFIKISNKLFDKTVI